VTRPPFPTTPSTAAGPPAQPASRSAAVARGAGTDDSVSGAGTAAAPAPPEQAQLLFGAELERAVCYVELLADDGVTRGLIGPHEVARLWDRHVMNCAVVAELVPPGSRLVDVGSGAGLPGIVLALARADISVVLLEPLARRVRFLEDCRDRLALGNVEVHRGRAEEPQVVAAVGGADIVTARAVARLDRLVGWCLPLLHVGGRLLALKGESAAAELTAARAAIARVGGRHAEILRCGVSVVSPPTTVVAVTRGTVPKARGGRGR
jgi:16S rRNA (guanine527-N7)-methyltransferase